MITRIRTVQLWLLNIILKGHRLIVICYICLWFRSCQHRQLFQAKETQHNESCKNETCEIKFVYIKATQNFLRNHTLSMLLEILNLWRFCSLSENSLWRRMEEYRALDNLDCMYTWGSAICSSCTTTLWRASNILFLEVQQK